MVELLAGREERIEIEVCDHGFGGARRTPCTGEMPGANASLPAYRTRIAVRLSGTCSAAGARPVRVQAHQRRRAEGAGALDLDPHALTGEPDRALDHHVHDLRILRVAARLRDAKPRRALHRPDQRELRARPRRRSARAVARCGRAGRSHRGGAGSSGHPESRARAPGHSPPPTPAARCQPVRASTATPSAHRQGPGKARRAAGSPRARRPAWCRPVRPPDASPPRRRTRTRARASRCARVRRHRCRLRTA